MSQQLINIGQAVNDKSGDPLRTAFDKVNQNFTELYLLSGVESTDVIELVQDYASSMIADGTHNGVTVVYDDNNNKLNFTVNIDGGNASTNF